jgi:hypothetical protein
MRGRSLKIEFLTGDERYSVNYVHPNVFKQLPLDRVGWPFVFSMIDGTIVMWPDPAEKDLVVDISLSSASGET